MRSAAVAGTGSFLPGEPLGNEVVERLFGTEDNYLSSLLGTKFRYWATDPSTFELRYHNSDLAVNAGRAALEAAGLEPAQIQLLIVNSCTPDYLMPPMSPIVQEKLGISECAVIELRSGCVGSIAALAIGSQFIASGTYQNALIIASELSSSYGVLPLREKREITLDERLNGIMFGDGAGAVVLVGNDSGGRGVERTCMNSIGCGKPAGMMFPVGGSSHPFSREFIDNGDAVLRHDRRAVVRWGREMSVRALKDLCTVANITPEEIDCFIFPQANPGLLKQDTKVIPEERVVVNVDEVGNVISAGVLIAFDSVVRGRRLSPSGGRVALIGGEASKWLYGAALIRL
jgi:3-oxoacyl-[acyl-carrier-protein] synthase-3